MLNEAVRSQQVQLQHLSGGTEKSYVKPQSRQQPFRLSTEPVNSPNTEEWIYCSLSYLVLLVAGFPKALVKSPNSPVGEV